MLIIFIKNKILGSIALLSLVFASSLAAQKLQFEDLPRLVKERNQHAHSAVLRRESAEAGVGHLERSYLPRLSSNLGYETFRTGTQSTKSQPYASIDATLNLYRGGRDTIQDKIVNTRSEIASSESEETIRYELEKARIAYWNLVAQREASKIIKNAISENQQNLKSALTRVSAGISTDTDKIEFELHKIALEQDLAQVELGIKSNELELAVLLGFPKDAEIKTPVEVLHSHEDILLATSFNVDKHPKLRAIKLKQEEASLEQKKALRAGNPALDLYASYGLYTYRELEYQNQSDRDQGVVGAKLTFDLFDGGQAQTEANQSDLAARSLQLEHSQSEKELEAEIENAKAGIKLSHELIHKQEEAIYKTKQYLNQSLDEYNKGIKNSPDILSALEKKLQMQLRFVELRRDYQLARTRLLGILGE